MYLEESKTDRFLGTGELNANGDTLSAFLKKYDPNRYQNPGNTVDTLVFTYREKEGHRVISRLLLIKRGNHPSIGWWALPGGFVEYREDLDHAALRELQEETGVADIETVQFKSYGAYDRDPRTRIITTAYVALVPEDSICAKAGDDASDSGWFELCDTLVEEKTDGKQCTALHRLELYEPERRIKTTTMVAVRRRMDAILPDAKYEVVNTELLAADHGAIILEGYHYVSGLLNN